jgi:hypothetical protein
MEEGMPRTSSFGGRVVVALALGLATCSSDEKPTDRAPMPTVPPPGSQAGVPWVGPMGITESVADMMARDANAPPIAPRLGPERDLPREGLPQAPGALPVSQWPPPGPTGSHRRGGPENPQTSGLNFTGATFADGGLWPPDSMGAAGPTQFFVYVNNRLRTFSKSTGMADGVVNMQPDSFFSTVRGLCSTSDPGITFDRLSGRWILTMINIGSTACDGTSANSVLIAVSDAASKGVITASTTFTLFGFQQDMVIPVGPDGGHFADYPRHGVDANALYIGLIMFDPNCYAGSTGFVVQKSSILNGGPIVVTPFRQLAASPTYLPPNPPTIPACTPNAAGVPPGPVPPLGVGNDDPASTEGYFIGADAASLGLLQIRRVTNPGTSPTISSNISLTVPATALPGSPNVVGSPKPLDAIDDRLGSAQLKNGSLWTVHTNLVTSTGVSSSSGTRDGVRWYEITNLMGTPTLRESGTLFDPASTGVKNYWMGSIAASGQGHVAIGASFGGPSDHPGVALAGRLSGDALGLTEAVTQQAGGTSGYVQTTCPNPCNVYRWGDYSTTTVDPNDNMTMWTIQEIVAATNSWGVKINKLLAPPPATPSSVSPSTVVLGDTVDVAIVGTTSAGSGFYDPGAGFPNHMTGTVSGAGVMVNSVTFTDPTHITANLTISTGAATGTRTITITNPDGQSATSASALLTISACSVPADCHNGCGCVGGNCGNWANALASGATSAPYTIDGRTFIGSDSQLAGFDETTGAALTGAGFPKMAGGPIENFPVVAPLLDTNEYVLYTAQDGFLYKVNVASGATTSVDLRRGTSPLAACITGAACASDVIQGTPAVQLNTTTAGGQKDLIFLVTHHGCGDTTGNAIIAIDASNLSCAWQASPVPAGGMSWGAEGGDIDYAANRVYFGTHSDAAGQQTVWAVHTPDGHIDWTAATGSVITRPQLGRGSFSHLFVADTGGTLSAFNAANGTTAWTRGFAGASFTNNIWAEFRGTYANTIFLTDATAGAEYAVNDGGGSSTLRWGPISFGSAKVMTAPSVWSTPGKLYVGLDDGTAVELDIAAQTTKTHLITKSATPAAGNICSEPTFAIQGSATDINRVITGVNGPAGTLVRQVCAPF